MQTSIITFDGKLDNLVGFKNNSGGYSLRKRIKPNQPNSPQQIIARTKFKVLSDTAKNFSDALLGLTNYAKQHRISLRNAFMKLNYPVVNALDPLPQGAIQAEQLKYNLMSLSHGSAPSVNFQNPSFSTPQTVTVVFNNNPLLNPNDIAVVVVYLPQLNICVSDYAEVNNSVVAVSLPALAAGEPAVVFAYTQHFNTAQARIDYETSRNTSSNDAIAYARSAAANSDFSNTAYLGEGTIG